MISSKTPSIQYQCRRENLVISVQLEMYQAENLSPPDIPSGAYATIQVDRRGLCLAKLRWYAEDDLQLNSKIFDMFRTDVSPKVNMLCFESVCDLCDTMTSDITTMVSVLKCK